MKHAQPARVAETTAGTVEKERDDAIRKLIRWTLNAAFVLPPGYKLSLIEANGRGIEVYEKSITTCDENLATSILGSSVMLKGTVGFGNIDPFQIMSQDIMRATAHPWDHTVNTQILPAFIGPRWGPDALMNATTIETSVDKPADRKQEAESGLAWANALKALVEALAAAQIAAGVAADKAITVDAVEVMVRAGIPTRSGVAPAEQVPADAKNPGPGGAPALSGGGSAPVDPRTTSAGARALGHGTRPLAASFREDDHPRDEKGRFSSHGSRGAADASRDAHAKKDAASHEAAQKAHESAAEKHRAEAVRRRALAAKRGTKKADRERHLKAADRHDRAAIEHDKLADFHENAIPKTLEQLGIEHGDLEKETKKVVEGAIHKGGYQRYLKDHPLSTVQQHSSEVEDVRSSSNGVYNRKAQAISLKDSFGFEAAHLRAQSKWKKLGRLGKVGTDEVYSLSTLAKTPEEMSERTMVHEIGHHIHLDEKNPLDKGLYKEIKKAHAARVEVVKVPAMDLHGNRYEQKTVKVREGQWVASVYGRGDHKEWWAETHSAYIYYPKTLKKNDPDAFALVQRVRQARGLE